MQVAFCFFHLSHVEHNDKKTEFKMDIIWARLIILKFYII
jgi:hypothetical protein